MSNPNKDDVIGNLAFIFSVEYAGKEMRKENWNTGDEMKNNKRCVFDAFFSQQMKTLIDEHHIYIEIAESAMPMQYLN